MASIPFPRLSAGPTVIVELVGDLDRTTRERLDVLLEALGPVPQEVVLDVTEAWSDSAHALARLCRFRAARHAEGLGCRLRGLHPAVAPGWERVPLEHVFAVYADSHDDAAPFPTTGAGRGRRDASGPAPGLRIVR